MLHYSFISFIAPQINQSIISVKERRAHWNTEDQENYPYSFIIFFVFNEYNNLSSLCLCKLQHHCQNPVSSKDQTVLPTTQKIPSANLCQHVLHSLVLPFFSRLQGDWGKVHESIKEERVGWQTHRNLLRPNAHIHPYATIPIDYIYKQGPSLLFLSFSWWKLFLHQVPRGRCSQKGYGNIIPKKPHSTDK